MASSRTILLVCVGFLVIVSTYARRCYDCSSCNDEFEPRNSGISIVPCTGSCMKIKGNGNVMRSCSPISLGDKCEGKAVNNVEGDVCSCTQDLCNSASGLNVSMTTAFVSVLTVFLRQLF